MILKRCVVVQVLFILVICAFPENVISGSSSSSKGSKSKSSSSSKGSKGSLHRSRHQLDNGEGSLTLRPSKPDPHFEILDEQRAYYNYGSRLREGRTSSRSLKSNTPNEKYVASPSSTYPSSPSQNQPQHYNKKKCCSNKKGKSSSISSAVMKEIPSPSLSSLSSSSSSMETSMFFRKSSTDEAPHSTRFSGSQLISGDAGTSRKIKASQVDQAGWKILTGPSIPPDAEEESDSGQEMSKRSFTSITDGNYGEHRSSTKLKESGGDKRKGKQNTVHPSSSSSSSSSSSNSSPTSTNFGVLPEYLTAQSISESQKSRRGKATFKSSSLRSMESSIPKHKYATVTRRAPNKPSSSSSSSSSSSYSKQRAQKKLQMSQSSKNSFKASQPMKFTNDDSGFTISSSGSGSFEEGTNTVKTSPVMTLDTKKLILESDMNDVEPSGQNTISSSTSLEAYSGERGSISDLSPSPSEPTIQSRYEPIPLPTREELRKGSEKNERGGGSKGNNNDDSVHLNNFYNLDEFESHSDFQTKTALNPTSSEYPSFSVSASMNYNNKKANNRREHRKHRREPIRGSVSSASASEEAPVVQERERHKTRSKMRSRTKPRYQNIRHHVDDMQHYPGPGLQNVIEDNAHDHDDSQSHRHHERIPDLSPEVIEPLSPPSNQETRGFIIDTVVQHPTPLKQPDFASGLSSSKLPLPSFHGHLHAIDSTPSTQPPALPSFDNHIPPHPPEPFHAQPPYPGPSHNIPHYLAPHHPPYPYRRPPFPPPPHFHHHRHPIQLPLPPGVKPPLPPPPLADGSARKFLPPGEHTFEFGKLVPHHSPPPPIGIDPQHPVVQEALKNPQSILNDGIYLEPTSSSNIQETTKKYFQDLQNLHFKVHKNSLIPLDKRLVYLSMIFSWMFWITAFYTYYRWNANGGHHGSQFVLNVPHDGANPQVTTRALDTSSPWNFTKVLEYIEIAQKTYEGFDWQDLNCQKRTLCELVQKQNDPWGETGRKLANSYVYRVMDALDGIPIPQLIQTYLRQYKEAITQGKNSNKDCGQLYPQCKFSIKEVLNKAAAKKKA